MSFRATLSIICMTGYKYVHVNLSYVHVLWPIAVRAYILEMTGYEYVHLFLSCMHVEGCMWLSLWEARLQALF